MGRKPTFSVRISRAEYEALLIDRDRIRAVEAALGGPVDLGGGRRSPIAYDPELAAFIFNEFRRHTLGELTALCRAKFGSERAPSKSAIHRFLTRSKPSKKAVKQTLKPASK